MNRVKIYLNETERVILNQEGGLEAEEFVYDIGWVVRNEMSDKAILEGLIAAQAVIAANIQKFS